MFIYFLRHASAGEPSSNPLKDEARALDEDGIAQCKDVGRALAALDSEVDLMISSPLKRAAQTAELVGRELGCQDDLVFEDALRPGAAYGAFLSLLAQHSSHSSIFVVGHNPNLSDFLGRLIGDSRTAAAIELKKGAVAKVEMEGGHGSLHWCITPKVVRSLYAAATRSSRPKTSRK
jgi:phosphohistidine phosphatase